MKQVWKVYITNKNEAWHLHCLVDQIHTRAVDLFRTFVLVQLGAWHAYRVTAPRPSLVQNATQATQPSFDRYEVFKTTSLEGQVADSPYSISASQTAGDLFRMRTEPSFNEDTQEALDILDQRMSQEELGTASMGSSEFIQQLLCWLNMPSQKQQGKD